MAEAALVDADIELGRQVVEALDAEPPASGLRPTAAFWFLFPEESTWRLVLALPAATTKPPQEVYGELLDVVQRALPYADVPMDAIGVAPPGLPLIQLLRGAIQTTGDSVSGIRFSHNVINGHLIEDAYVYRLT
jgi:hypothetical protein